MDDFKDMALMKAVARGDESALLALYEAHGGRVYAYLLRLLGRADEAEEVLDDLFFSIWKRASSYDPARGVPLTWFFAIARSRAIDQLRRRQRADRPIALPAPEPMDPHALVWEKIQGDRVRQAVGALIPAEREVLEACYFQGLSQSEAAQAIGIPLGTVKTRARSALVHLRTIFREAGVLR